MDQKDFCKADVNVIHVIIIIIIIIITIKR